MDKLLYVKNIIKYYANNGVKTKALDQISFEVDEGEFICIMGPSGSGKTTLLNCLSAIDTISSGHILLNGREISDISDRDMAAFWREHLGFIFQDFNLLDTLTLEENIALPLVIKKEAANKINVQIQLLADELGLSDSMKKFPYQVSGGQRQRCAFARAVIDRPDLIMADEPTGALDSISANILLNKMLKFNEELHTTIFMVTHDAFSASFSKRILFLKDGKIFCEIFKKEKSQSIFYSEILHVLSNMGDVSYVE